MTARTSEYQYWLFLLVLFYGVVNWVVLKQDNVPFCYDEGGIYEMSRIYYHHLIENFIPNPKMLFYHYWNTTHFYPPFYMLAHLPLFFLFGESQDVSAMTNVVFLAILLFSIYGIGKKIKDEQAGFFAAVLVSTFPAVFGFSRTDFSVLALTALITLSVYFLLKTECFSNKKYTILFGISMGLGELVSLTCFIYIFIPLVVYLVMYKRDLTKRRVINLFISLSIFLLVFFSWFMPNLISNNFMAEKNRLLGPKIGAFAEEFTPIYLDLMYRMLHSFYFFLLSGCILLFVFLKIKYKYLLLLGFIFPLLFFTLFYSVESRYVFPILPLGGLIISSTIGYLKSSRIRKIICYCILVFGLIEFLFLTFKAKKHSQFTQEQYIQRREAGLLSSSTVYWPIDKTLHILNDYKLVYKENSKPAEVIVLSEGPFISALSYEARLPAQLGRIEEAPYSFILCLMFPFRLARTDINNPEYIMIEKTIIKHIPRGCLGTFKRLQQQFDEVNNMYEVLDAVSFDNKTLTIYVNKNLNKILKEKKRFNHKNDSCISKDL